MHAIAKLASIKRSAPAMKAALPDLPVDQTVMVRLIRILATTTTDYFEPVFRNAGLAENTFHVLCLLISSEDGHSTPGELTELVGTSKANMSRILDQLLEKDYISRTAEPMDARRYIIGITEKGRERTAAEAPKIHKSLLKAFSGLTDNEFKMLNQLILKAILSLDTGGVMSFTREIKSSEI